MTKRFLSVVVSLVLLSACSDANVMSPADGLVTGPSLALVDAGNSGPVDGFWFLPPLAKTVTTSGTFDPGLAPSMQVCELEGNPSELGGGDPGVSCVEPRNVVAEFSSDQVSVGTSSYQFSWNTEDDGTMDAEKFYRIEIYLEDEILGWLDVNPQVPSGQSPGEDFADLYAFRLGETLPVKFFLTPQARCALAEYDLYVIQCAAQGVIDQNGGTVTLFPEQPSWPTISVIVPASALPAGYPAVILTLERIDPVLFLAEFGYECVPGLAGFSFDAPMFGDCLRVTTSPTLPNGELEDGALAYIEICLDLDAFPILQNYPEQANRPQIIRHKESGETYGLPMITLPPELTTCPPEEPVTPVGFFPVPEQEGFFRTAAMAANSVARWMGPEPLVAHTSKISTSSGSSGFSNFRWALPGEMTKPVNSGDGTIVQQPESGTPDYTVPVKVEVIDWALDPVQGATVHFDPAAGGNGSAAPSEDMTDVLGLAETDWELPSAPGTYTLEVSAYGLFDVPVPDHIELVPIEERKIYFTATVVGPPSTVGQTPDPANPIEGLPGETLTTPFVITVVDENGEPVVGYTVDWQSLCAAAPELCGSVEGDLVTDENGQATGYWTLADVPGANTLQVTVGGLTYTWNAVVGCQVVVNGAMGDGEWDCAAGNTATFVANLSGGSTPAELMWQTDGTNVYFLVRVMQSSLDKVNSLRIDFDNTGNGVSGDDDIIGFDGAAAYDWYLTDRCVNRSQSSCGAADTSAGGTKDVAAALGNDGTWSVYEFSHPLSGGPRDFSKSVGDQIGLFVTLGIGNGAQGNTQWPGFRNYLTITIQ